MSNSTIGSQDSVVNTSEAEVNEKPKAESPEMNFNEEVNESIEYTYHKHSAPKDVIYYRCSDKRCPAKVRYNPQTKEFAMKNQHLNQKIHKKPCSQKTISSDDLIEYSDLITRGPLVISKAHMSQ